MKVGGLWWILSEKSYKFERRSALPCRSPPPRPTVSPQFVNGPTTPFRHPYASTGLHCYVGAGILYVILSLRSLASS